MAEPITIDTSKLTKSAIAFGDGMVAFLDTELAYIEYLRNRNTSLYGMGGFADGPEDLINLDYSKKYEYRRRRRGWGFPRRLRNARPRRGFPQSKENRFRQHRQNRLINQKLRKMGLHGKQIDAYRNLKAQGLSTPDALAQAKKVSPSKGTNIFKRAQRYIGDMIPNRPRWATRLGWGPLRPGVRERAMDAMGNFVRPITTKVDDFARASKKRIFGFVLKNMDEFLPFLKVFYKGGAGKIIKRIPFGLGAIIDAVIMVTFFKESIGRAIFRAVGATLGSWAMAALFAAAGAFIGGGPIAGWLTGPIGGIVGGVLGGMIGDWLGGWMYDSIFGRQQQGAGINPNAGTTNKNKEGSIQLGAAGSGPSPGSVITSPTRGLKMGQKTLVGEAGEAELILPMSKIGDAISAVYREGASVMVGAAIAFLGPFAGNSPAAASLYNQAKRVAAQVGADKSVYVEKIHLPDLPPIFSEKSTQTIASKEVKDADTIKRLETASATGSSNASENIKIAGQAMWKTILPEGQPIFSSPYGMRGSRMHRGIDIGVWENSPVHAQEDGVIEQIVPKFGKYGGAVVVVHKDGTANLYGHVGNYTVEPGQKVHKGDKLAEITYYPGTDGSNQSHLHFERFDSSGNRVDPMPYFSGGSTLEPTGDSKGGSVGTGQDVLKDISSAFVNMGSTVNSMRQQLIDSPVNQTNVGGGGGGTQIVPVPQVVPVAMVRTEYVPVEEQVKDQHMVISVFGKGASRV